MVVGGGAGTLHGGRHVKFGHEPSMANLLVTLMDNLGVHVDRVGGSDGSLPLDMLDGL
jgi:hypothetical protein